MANSKISSLTSATTPLAGTETLPIVQSGATVKATIANVQAATVSAGTANAVQYLNGSKIPTTGTAFQFDGTNIGLAVSPAAWDTNSRAFQLRNAGGLYDLNFGGVSTYTFLTNNSYRAVGGSDKYLNSYPASYYLQNNGTHAWGKSTDATPTAGNTITWGTVLSSDTSGNLNFGIGNLVQGTAAKGINFTANTPAAGMTSQLLNWYEEGTFTPQLLGGTTNPTVTYTTQSGYYTRVGRLVTCQIYIQISGATGGSGTLLVNLPFTANAANQGSGSCAQYNVTYTGTQLSAVVTSGAANLSFLGQTTNTAWSQLTTANLKAVATQAFSITVSYFV